jgi:hypothetical protein
MLSPIVARARDLLPCVVDRGALRLHEVIGHEPASLHAALSRLNARRMRPGRPGDETEADIWESAAATIVERDFLEQERARVAPLLVDVPRDVDAFLGWYEALRETGPGQGDPLFPWLAEHATEAQMRWFIRQEMAGEAGFDDLLALTQLQLSTTAKLELARNYWDEMGRGKVAAMHGPMLAAVGNEFGIASDDPEPIVWEAMALANVLTGLAINRVYTYQSIGALGSVELTSPGRCEHVTAGLERLGHEGPGSHYYRLHATVDIRHSRDWNQQVLRPLVADNPDLAVPIAEGALMRLSAGARCFHRYREQFRLS